MPESDVTLGELSRRMVSMEGRMSDGFAAVNRRLDSLQFVNQETYRVEISAMSRRLDELEDAKKWTARTFVAAFLFPVLVGILVAVVLAL